MLLLGTGLIRTQRSLWVASNMAYSMIIPSSGVRTEGRRLAVSWPCISVPVGEVLAESQMDDCVSLPACASWRFMDALCFCLCEGTLPLTALGHQQAFPRIAEKCFIFPRGCYINK